jgi:hypothetical protein
MIAVASVHTLYPSQINFTLNTVVPVKTVHCLAEARVL